MFTAKIPTKEHANVMSSFWQMMMELERDADQDSRVLERHMVEGWFRQWNDIMSDNKEPIWIRRGNKSR